MLYRAKFMRAKSVFACLILLVVLLGIYVKNSNFYRFISSKNTTFQQDLTPATSSLINNGPRPPQAASQSIQNRQPPPTTKLNTMNNAQPILLFIGIFSAPVHIDRRNAVRETWMTKCRTHKSAVCWFVTDGQDTKGNLLQGEIKKKLDDESERHGDLILAESPGGVNFGRRYLWVVEWASLRYDFQFVLRVDDDYFVCFDRLLLELQFHRPKKLLTWGWLHCSVRGAVYIDEGFIIISRDVIKSFLDRKNSSLMCHPFGDQSIGMWLNDMPSVAAFADNPRIFHISFDTKERVAQRTEVCHTALGIHRSYPEEMKMYWNINERESKSTPYAIPPVTFGGCLLPRVLDYRVFAPAYSAIPKPCKDNPVWDRGETFKGRQGQ